MKLKIRKKNIAIFLLFSLMFILRIFIFSPVSVSGVSMEPTLYSGEKGIILKNAPVNRNDVICFTGDKETNELFIKRVIGVAGDLIRIEHNKIFVNDSELDEPYLIAYPANSNFNLVDLSNESFIVPEKMIFVLGDNRIKSFDSREFGFVSEKAIIGKLVISFGLRNN